MRKKYLPFILGALMMSVSLPAHAWLEMIVSFFAEQIVPGQLSSLRIATQQTAVSAHVVSEAELNSKKTLADAVAAIQQSDRVYEALANYSEMTGQPITNKCVALGDNATAVKAMQNARKDARTLMESYSAARVGSSIEKDNEALDTHRKYYCTVSEAKQGMCELYPNGMQWWDTNYSGPFGESTLSPDSELAAYAYTQMVLDTRAEAVIDCKSASCSAASTNHLGTNALGSMAAASFIGQATERRIVVTEGSASESEE
jgi:hypothetical protein